MPTADVVQADGFGTLCQFAGGTVFTYGWDTNGDGVIDTVLGTTVACPAVGFTVFYPEGTETFPINILNRNPAGAAYHHGQVGRLVGVAQSSAYSWYIVYLPSTAARTLTVTIDSDSTIQPWPFGLNAWGGGDSTTGTTMGATTTVTMVASLPLVGFTTYWIRVRNLGPMPGNLGFSFGVVIQ
jgi:hypothetical protein